MAAARRYSDVPLPIYGGSSSTRTLTRLRRNRSTVIVGFFVLVIIFFLSRGHSNSKEQGIYAGVQWNQYAYSLYATDGPTLCNAVMVLESLERLGSKADRVLFYPKHWNTQVESSADRNSQLLVLARDKYKAMLMPTKPLTIAGHRSPSHPKKHTDPSPTKLLAFSLTHYTRVLALDTDITLLRSLDPLFLLTPPSSIAMPRAYTSTTHTLDPLFLLLTPNTQTYTSLASTIASGADPALVASGRYTTHLLNTLFAPHALILPQRPYALQSSEFRAQNHTAYLGLGSDLSPESDAWDPHKVLQAAALVHFDDAPLPPPWVMWPTEGLAAVQPDCGGARTGSCAERVVWKGLYEGFRERRKGVCKLLSAPAPDWFEIVAGLKEREKGNGQGSAVEEVRKTEEDGSEGE